MPLYRRTGDLLAVDVDHIVQQCNCLTVRPHGLSADIAKRLGSNPYESRCPEGKRNLALVSDRGTPGSVVITGRVVNLMAQWRPGKIGSPYFHRYPESNPPETAEQREKWFQACLDALGAVFSKSVAFPDHIGCGLAGGNWQHYEQMIEAFAKKNSSMDVFIIKMETFW